MYNSSYAAMTRSAARIVLLPSPTQIHLFWPGEMLYRKPMKTLAALIGCFLHCRILQIQAMGTVRSYCYHRLLLLEQRFNLHVMMNADKEFLAQKSAPHRDFYNVRKVCNHAIKLRQTTARMALA